MSSLLLRVPVLFRRRLVGYRTGVPKTLRRALTIACLTVGLVFASSMTAHAELPVPDTSLPALAQAVTAPDSDPAGANDWTCTPTAAHPNPVVLVHGTGANMTINWTSLSPLLKNAGYCVYALTYGQQPEEPRGTVVIPGSSVAGATGSIEESAGQLAAFVERVKASSGAEEVDIVGHSQGGVMPRYYVKSRHGASSVGRLIGLAPPNHGTQWVGGTLPGGSVLTELQGDRNDASVQQTTGSQFLADLNAGGDTVEGVEYTVIVSRYDEVVTPYTSAFLDGPNVRNITLQDACPSNLANHFSLAFDNLASSYVLNALDPTYPIAPCELSLPFVGN